MTSITEIPEDRDLTEAETSVVHWLLKHGCSGAENFLTQLDRARVASRCSCGCASINFAIDGIVPENSTHMTILSDYEWTDTEGNVFGAFVFARWGVLAGLDVWSQDGLATANSLPDVNQLRPVGTGTVGKQ
jgi:hypothetical protein